MWAARHTSAHTRAHTREEEKKTHTLWPCTNNTRLKTASNHCFLSWMLSGEEKNKIK